MIGKKVLSFSVALVLTVFTLPQISSAQMLSAEKTAKATPQRIAVVELPKIYDEYAKSKALLSSLKVEQDQIIEKVKDYNKQEADLREKLQKEEPKTKAYDKLIEKLQAVQLEKQKYMQDQQARILAAHQKVTLEIYNDILAVVKEIATARKFDLVLQKETPDLTKATSPQQLIKAISNAKVLFSASHVNITNDVLNLLNKKYSEAKGK